MRKLFFIDDSLANKISYYHLLLLLISLPFDYFYSHVIIISFTIHTLIQFKKSAVKPMLTLQNVVLVSVFMITLICTTYSAYKKEAYTELGRQIVILIFPLLFCINPLDIRKYKTQLLLGFALYCTGTTLYLFADAFRVIRYYHYPVSTIFSHAFTNHNFSNPIGMHATFLSLQLGLALIYLLAIVVKKGAWSTRIFYAICCCILTAGLIQLSSKSVFAVVFVVVNFGFPIFILHGRKRIMFLVAAIGVSAVLLVSIFNITTFRERYIKDLTEDLSRTPAEGTLDSRIERWGASVHLIGQSPIVGHGSGSELPLLKDEFFKRKLYNSFLNGLNSHNQYLSFLLKSGVLGLLVYLFTLAYGFSRAFKTKDIVFVAFMLLIAIVSLSENILDVDKGTMFYGFFYSFFIFSMPKLNPYATCYTDPIKSEFILPEKQPVE